MNSNESHPGLSFKLESSPENTRLYCVSFLIIAQSFHNLNELFLAYQCPFYSWNPLLFRLFSSSNVWPFLLQSIKQRLCSSVSSIFIVAFFLQDHWYFSVSSDLGYVAISRLNRLWMKLGVIMCLLFLGSVQFMVKISSYELKVLVSRHFLGNSQCFIVGIYTWTLS